MNQSEAELKRLNTLYPPTPEAYTKGLEILKLLGHRTTAWTVFGPNDRSTTICNHCHSRYVLGGSYGAPVYYLNQYVEAAGPRGELFDSSVILSFDSVAASEFTAKHLAKDISTNFFCKKIESFL